MLICFTAPRRTWHGSFIGLPLRPTHSEQGAWETRAEGHGVCIARPTLPALRRRMAEIRWRARVGLPPFGHARSVARV